MKKLDPQAAAAYCQCSRSLIYDLIKRRIIPCYRPGIGKGKILINPADLEAWLESRRVAAVPVGPARGGAKTFRHVKLP